MKKVFTFIFAFLCAMSFTFAQSLSLRYGTTDINDGDTLEVTVPQLNATVDYYLDLTNVSDDFVPVKVYKYELDMVQGATATFCFGSMCYQPSVGESNIVTIPDQTTLGHPSPDAFHLAYKTPIAGISYVQFVFANNDNDDDHISMTFKLVYDPSSIVSSAVATKMNAYPNPASENVTIEYNYSGSSNDVKLMIKNLVGATLYTRKLDASANKLRVDVSEYPSGIYFYSIEADGRPLITKKLLVK